MKKLALFILMILGISSISAQTKKEENIGVQPNVVKMLTEHGHLHKREYYPIFNGEYSYEHKVLIVTDVISNLKYGCIRISAYKNDEGALELFEIDDFVKALTYIKDNVLSSIPETKTSYTYTSLHGIEISAHQASVGWVPEMTLSRRATPYRLGSAENIEKIIASLLEAKSMIIEKTK